MADYGYELYSELLGIIALISYNEARISYNEDYTSESASLHQMDPNNQDSVESSSESAYNRNDSGIGPIASPNLTEVCIESRYFISFHSLLFQMLVQNIN